MNSEIKKKWLEALRSGDYKQGKSNLRKNDTFCCLGVLCDLHSKETDNKWREFEDKTRNFYIGNDTILPLEVSQWAGLDSWGNDSGCLEVLNLNLPGRNDAGASFIEIADIIEENL